jgi:hypothetical protein
MLTTARGNLEKFKITYKRLIHIKNNYLSCKYCVLTNFGAKNTLFLLSENFGRKAFEEKCRNDSQ